MPQICVSKPRAYMGYMLMGSEACGVGPSGFFEVGCSIYKHRRTSLGIKMVPYIIAIQSPINLTCFDVTSSLAVIGYSVVADTDQAVYYTSTNAIKKVPVPKPS